MTDNLLSGWRPYALLAFIGFAVFARTLTFGFSGLDDGRLIVDNFKIIKSFSNLPRIFQQGPYLDEAPASQYRPIHILSFMLDAQFGGEEPLVYHLTNILTHIVGAGLVFLLLNTLGYNRIPSFLFSALFTVHPLLTQAVAWIPGRNDPQLAIFVLLSFLCFLEFLKAGKLWLYFAHLLFFVVALLTKETAIGLTLICPLYVWLISGDRKRETRLYSFGALAAGSLWLIIRQTAFAESAGYTIPYLARSVFMNSPALLAYAGKIFFPFNLSALPILRDCPLAYGVITVLLLSVSLLISREKRWPYVLFGASWFILFVLPILVKLKSYPVLLLLENRAYLPLVGFIIVLLEIDFIKKAGNFPKISLPLGAALIILFSALTISHSGAFSSPIKLWQNAALNSPHFAHAHQKLGRLYFSLQDFKGAEKECQKCIELDPADATAHHNLAAAYIEQRRYRDAEREYEKELKIKPNSGSRVKLGAVYCRSGKLDRAEKVFLSCLKSNHSLPRAHYYLGGIYLTRKQHEKAKIEYLKELKINPSDADALFGLAAVYYRQGRLKQAVAALKKAAKAAPDRMEIYQELAYVNCRLKNFAEGARYLDEVRKRGGSVADVLLRARRL